MGHIDSRRLEALREMGWGERDIFDALSHAARNVASDILFNAFGLRDESF